MYEPTSWVDYCESVSHLLIVLSSSVNSFIYKFTHFNIATREGKEDEGMLPMVSSNKTHHQQEPALAGNGHSNGGEWKNVRFAEIPLITVHNVS